LKLAFDEFVNETADRSRPVEGNWSLDREVDGSRLTAPKLLPVSLTILRAAAALSVVYAPLVNELSLVKLFAREL
jgi:hypothetical protein